MDVSSWMSTFDGMGFTVIRYLFSVLWQSSILFVLSGIVVYALNRRKKTVHFAIWTGTLFMFPLLPLVSLMLSSAGAPHKEVPVLPSYTARQIVAEQEIEIHTEEGSVITNYVIVPYKEEKGTASTSSKSLPLRFYEAMTSVFDYPWAIVFMTYTGCVLLYLLRILTGIHLVRRWVRNGKKVDGRFRTLFDDIRQGLGISRDVRIFESEKTTVPLTFQTLNPVIVVPEGFMESLSDTELKAVAVHEMVHVARNDSLIMTLSSLVKAFFFFHPLVRYAAREISYLAETIADTAVLETTEKPQSYAHLVSRLAENLPKRSLAAEYTAGIVVTRSVFFRRVKAILSHGNSKVRRLTAVSFAGVMLAMALSVLVTLALPLGEKKGLGDGTTTISGKVVHGDKPVTGVEIYTHKQFNIYQPYSTEQIARTSRDGSFQAVVDTLTDKAAHIDIIAFKQGYTLGIKALNQIIRKDDTINLREETVLSGLVKDTDNNPVRNATVTAIEMEVGNFYTIKHHLFVPFIAYLFNKDGTLPGMTVKTDHNGKFTLRSLPENTSARLSVIAPGYADNYGSVIQSGTTDNLIILNPEGQIEGRVVFESNGKPSKNTSIMIITHAICPSRYFFISETDHDGRYSFANLTAGTYRIQLTPEESFPELVAEPIPEVRLVESQTIQLPEIRLLKGGAVSGRMVHSDSGKPVSGKQIWAKYDEKESIGYLDYNNTDKDGYYRLRVPPGKIKIIGIGFRTMKEGGSFSSKEVENVIEIGDGDIKSDVDFKYSVVTPDTTLQKNKAVFDVPLRVIDPNNSPVADAWVYSYNIRDNKFFPSIMHNMMTDKDGIVTFPLIKDGTVLVIQAENNQRKLKGKSTITVENGAEAVIKMKHYKTTDIKARVVDETGSTVAGAGVRVDMGVDVGSSTLFTMLTNESGTFTVLDLPLGEHYKIMIGKESYEPYTISLSPLTENNIPLDDIVMKKQDEIK